MINPKGERVFLKKILDGYGELVLETDGDVTGKHKEIYMRKTTWGAAEIPNGVSVLRWDGSDMVTVREWTVFKSLERCGHRFLYQLKSNYPKQLLLVDKTSRLILLDEHLREQKHSYTGSVRIPRQGVWLNSTTHLEKSGFDRWFGTNNREVCRLS